MSQAAFLWKYFFEDDVHNFKQLLSSSSNAKKAQKQAIVPVTDASTPKSVGTSPGGFFSTSPTLSSKGRKVSGKGLAQQSAKALSLTLTKADVNSRDQNGVTIFHHIASSHKESALPFTLALLSHPLLDLYVQDTESGWTALHRALYAGNITIAREIISRNAQDLTSPHHKGAGSIASRPVFKVKDKEGNGPFDVATSTISERSLHSEETLEDAQYSDSESLDGSTGDLGTHSRRGLAPPVNIYGDELFFWGSNKNVSLGLGNEDDRQFPQRVNIKRPDHLLFRFHQELSKEASRRLALVDKLHATGTEKQPTPKFAKSLPTVVQHKQLTIQNFFMSKFHSAILTNDPEANLYICGFGPGGRLGTGDEATRFSFVCIEGGGLKGKRVVDVGLGHNHSLAVTDQGEIWSWGANNHGQLGYTITSRSKDEDTLQLSPRQLFGTLKKENIQGAAASRLHSVVFTSSALFTFGRNVGQLGLVDSDARSLELQLAPRRVAASLFAAPIRAVTAIERATVCLLYNDEVWIFANFGYTKAIFPLDGFTNFFVGRSNQMSTRYDSTPNHIVKVAAGGDTVCALSATGDVFTVSVSQKIEPSTIAPSSMNVAKIRGNLSQPQRIFSSTKSHMAVVDVDVSQDGSIVICTKSGAIWAREKRAGPSDSIEPSLGVGQRPKGWKFRRVPGLTGVTAVRSNAFGAFGALRSDPDVTKRQILIERRGLRDHLAPLLSMMEVVPSGTDEESDLSAARLWAPAVKLSRLDRFKRAILRLEDPEAEFSKPKYSQSADFEFDMEVSSSTSGTVLSVHQAVLAARSQPIRDAIRRFQLQKQIRVSDTMSLESGSGSTPRLVCRAVDFLTVLNLVVYLYQDTFVEFWTQARLSAKKNARYRQVRTQLMHLASQLNLRNLENTVRQITAPAEMMHLDFELAVADPTYMQGGDILVQLMYTEIKVHSVIMVQRCPFFEGLFHGRASGRWLDHRRAELKEQEDLLRIDLKHIDPAIFRLVLRYIYADASEEIFDEIRSSDLDEFLDVVLDVLSVANELMLDRLSQVCQKVLGRHVNMRNVCQLLNAAGPYSVTEFKDACLEYLCLNLEGMLENQLLDELDDDMMQELDTAVRLNQASHHPYIRSDVPYQQLVEVCPELPQIIQEERRQRIKDLMFRARQQEEEKRPSSNRARSSAVDIGPSASPTSDPRALSWKAETSLDKRLPQSRLTPHTAAISTTDDDIFTLEINDETTPYKTPTSSPALLPHRPKTRPPPSSSPSLSISAFPHLDGSKRLAKSPNPTQNSLPTSSPTQSRSSHAVALTNSTSFNLPIVPKMSQRERKKALQARSVSTPIPTPSSLPEQPTPGPPPQAWTLPSQSQSPSLLSKAQLPPHPSSKSTSTSTPPPQAPSSPPTTINRGLSSIIAQETALASARLAYAEARPLQDIQAEQAFEVWWDGESRRVQGREGEDDSKRGRGRRRKVRGRGERVGRGGGNGRERGGRGAKGVNRGGKEG